MNKTAKQVKKKLDTHVHSTWSITIVYSVVLGTWYLLLCFKPVIMSATAVQ